MEAPDVTTCIITNLISMRWLAVNVMEQERLKMSNHAIKRVLLFAWYLLGCLVSLPALVFILLSRWMGIKAEERIALEQRENKES